MYFTGRIRYIAEQIQEFILRWHQSGMNKRKFSKQEGLNYYTFGTWCDKLKNRPAGSTGFSEIKIPSASSLFAQVHLPSGIKIDFYQPVPAPYLQLILK